MSVSLLDSTIAPPLLLGGFLVLSFFVERHLLSRQVLWYYRMGFPFRRKLVPIPKSVEGTGETEVVCWASVNEEAVCVWPNPRTRIAPTGFHGLLLFHPGPRDVGLEFRYAPPWTPFFGMGWLLYFGWKYGDLPLTISVTVVLCLGMWFVYSQSAVRSAKELRWAFLKALDHSEHSKD